MLTKGSEITEVNNDGYSVLHSGALKARLNVVKWAIEKGCAVEQRTKSGFSALLLAAHSGSIEIIEYLVNEKGASLDVVCNSNCTPLMFAIRENKIEVVKWLLKHGDKSQLSKTCNEGFSPLLHAISNNFLDIAKLLVEHGANITDKPKRLNSALSLACFRSFEMSKWLLDLGAEVKMTNDLGYTPLLCACEYGNLALVKYLISEYGSSLAERATANESPLIIAASEGNIQLMKWLLEQDDSKATISEADKEGLTPLLNAAYSGRVEAMQLLLDAKASLDECSTKGNNVLSMAASSDKEVVVDFIKKLMPDETELTKFINKANSVNGASALHVASSTGSIKVLKKLI